MHTHTHTHTDSDTLIFIDFRADRMRQIVEALGIKPQFDTDKIPQDLVSIPPHTHNVLSTLPLSLLLLIESILNFTHIPCLSCLLPQLLSLSPHPFLSQSVYCMTEYNQKFTFPVIFPPDAPKNSLAEWLSIKNIPQFHTAGDINILTSFLCLCTTNSKCTSFPV